VVVQIYDRETTDTAGLLALLSGLSAAHGGAKIGHLGLVAHGSDGQVVVGAGDVWGKAGWQDGVEWQRWQDLLAADARFDLYSCSVAAGPEGEAFVRELAALTGADVFASNDESTSVTRPATSTWNCSTETASSFGPRLRGGRISRKSPWRACRRRPTTFGWLERAVRPTRTIN
jgi:hypothetical protein